MKRAAGSGTDSTRDTQVFQRGIRSLEPETRARSVLTRHVGHHADLDHLLRDRERLLEPARLHVRQIELPHEHRLGRPVGTADGEPLRRVLRPKTRRTRERCPAQEVHCGRFGGCGCACFRHVYEVSSTCTRVQFWALPPALVALASARL